MVIKYKMKLKIQDIKCKSLLKVVDRFINLNSTYKYLSKNFKINIEILRFLQKNLIMMYIGMKVNLYNQKKLLGQLIKMPEIKKKLLYLCY